MRLGHFEIYKFEFAEYLRKGKIKKLKINKYLKYFENTLKNNAYWKVK